jgi:hypothetical protein
MKTTEEHFKLFQEEVMFWLDYYGLKDWYVSTNWEFIDNGNLTRASIVWNVSNRFAAISLNTEWNDTYDLNSAEFMIRVSAFHEVTELLLAPLTCLVNEIHPEDRVQESLHYIVRTLENTIFRQIRQIE